MKYCTMNSWASQASDTGSPSTPYSSTYPKDWMHKSTPLKTKAILIYKKMFAKLSSKKMTMPLNISPLSSIPVRTVVLLDGFKRCKSCRRPLPAKKIEWNSAA